MEFDSTPRLSRRTLLETFLAAGSLPLLAESRADAQVPGAAPRPFRVNIPQATIDRILNRVRETRWPDRLEVSDWRYGANWDYMKALAEYWTTQFDWRKAETNLNRYPQFLARVGDFDVHFYHVKGRGPKPVPLILNPRLAGLRLRVPGSDWSADRSLPLRRLARRCLRRGCPLGAGIRVFLQTQGQTNRADDHGHALEPAHDRSAGVREVRLTGRRRGKRDHQSVGPSISRFAPGHPFQWRRSSASGRSGADRTGTRVGPHSKRVRLHGKGLLQRTAAQARDRGVRSHGQPARHGRVDCRKAETLERFARRAGAGLHERPGAYECHDLPGHGHDRQFRVVLPRQGGRNIQSHRKSEFADRFCLFSPRVADLGSTAKRPRAKFQFDPVHEDAARRTFRVLGTTAIARGRSAKFLPKITKLTILPAGCGKTQSAVILSEAKNLSVFLFLCLNRQKFLRFAQNGKTGQFFRSLLGHANYLI